jgi:hypothetical protein
VTAILQDTYDGFEGCASLSMQLSPHYMQHQIRHLEKEIERLKVANARLQVRGASRLIDLELYTISLLSCTAICDAFDSHSIL